MRAIAQTRAWSLQGRLTMIKASAALASLLLGGSALYWAASMHGGHDVESRLGLLGASALTCVETDSPQAWDRELLMHVALGQQTPASNRYQVWSMDGTLLLSSHPAWAQRRSTALPRLGFDSVSYDGTPYRTLALPTRDRRHVVEVAENVDHFWERTGFVAFYYAAFLLVPLGLVSAAAWRMQRTALRPISVLAGQLRQTQPRDAAPQEAGGAARELVPLPGSLDTLLARVGDALAVERRFTSVAAHEMRMPLAALRAHAQLALEASSEADRSESLKSLVIGADRASHALDQLLDLARIESLPGVAGLTKEGVSLSQVFGEIVDEIGWKGTAKQITVTANFPVGQLNCHRFALFVLLRNLMVNAIHYTPVGGSVRVTSSAGRGTGVVLNIDDSGAGIPERQREQAFERFNRLGQTKINGVGLGLSICLSVIKMHCANVRLLDSPLGGLRVEIVFPE